ncbi:sialate O-acetylesterase [Puteibacter caeruleilacunae]|nr:sialate O-acetylesterase [Puteibacter caeruleilacunae]
MRSAQLKILILPLLLCLAIGSFAQSGLKKVRVACVGNSVTFGYGINDREENCYPHQLNKMLGEGYEVGNFGHSGATLLKNGHKPYWKQQAFSNALSFGADIVIIHLGLNDTDPRNWPNYRDDFMRDYSALIDTFRSLPSKPKVMICKMTPIFHQHRRFKSGTRDWFWQIQAHIERVAKSNNVELIDLHTPLYCRPDLFPDAIHPTKEGATILANTVYGAITGNYGKFQLAEVFGDHMVLQRRIPIKIWGKGQAGEKVTAEFNGKQAEAVIDFNGKWMVTFPAMEAGGPFNLSVITKDAKVAVNDILIGEVWVCSGQSNMAWRVDQSKHGKETIEEAGNSQIRLFNMKTIAWAGNKKWDAETLDKVNKLQFYESSWKLDSKESAAEFSAIGYYFGKKIQETLGVPVGLIHNAKGGSTTEAWIDRKTLEFDPVLVDVLSNWEHNDFVQEWARGRAQLNISNAKTKMQRHPFHPAYLYESGIAQLTNMSIAGFLWYQGESNAHNVEFHEYMFPKLVESWRKAWGKELPFYYVQLSSLNRPTWGHFRDSQRRLLNIIPNAGMAVSSDHGSKNNVHPTNKKPVGERLAAWALAQTYGQRIAYSGPLFKSVVYTNGKAEIAFTHSEGLTSSDAQELRTFELAGIDGIFYPAQAIIKKSKVIVECKEVSNPTMVRYGYEPFTKGNLVNKAGFPASTFTTEFEK